MASPNFKDSEFVVTNTGLPNNLPDTFILNRDVLCRQLQKIRDYVGRPVVINSAFRSPAVNKAVGGVKNSRHLTCLAADIVCPSLPVLSFLCEVLNSTAILSKIIIEPSWLHVEVDFRLENSSLFFGSDDRPSYLINEVYSGQLLQLSNFRYMVNRFK